MASRPATSPDTSVGAFSEDYRCARLCCDAVDQALEALHIAPGQFTILRVVTETARPD